jgi:hypothetical protein
VGISLGRAMVAAGRPPFRVGGAYLGLEVRPLSLPEGRT